MNITLAIIGTWLIADGIYSIALYVQWYKQSQTWRRDHWVRLARILCGLVLVVISYLEG